MNCMAISPLTLTGIVSGMADDKVPVDAMKRTAAPISVANTPTATIKSISSKRRFIVTSLALPCSFQSETLVTRKAEQQGQCHSGDVRNYLTGFMIPYGRL